MRREWSEAVRYGRWWEFEQWAKEEPSQALADAMSAIESSIGGKPARKALKKALYILSKQGIEPLDPDDQAEESEAKAPPPGAHRAYLSTVTPGWMQAIRYMVPGVRFHPMAFAQFSDPSGYLKFEETKVVPKILPWVHDKLYHEVPPPQAFAIVPVEYAAFRLSKVWNGRTRGEVPRNLRGVWKRLFESSQEDVQHPTAPMNDARLSDQGMANFMREHAQLRTWRFWIGDNNVLRDELNRIEFSAISESAKLAKRREAFLDVLEGLVDKGIGDWIAWWLRDTALVYFCREKEGYSLDDKGAPYKAPRGERPDCGAKQILGLARDLELRMHRSPVARALVELTIENIADISPTAAQDDLSDLFGQDREGFEDFDEDDEP